MTPKTRSLNLVFQGGGVRGLAYAGIISQIPPHIAIKGVGGTSVGALVAALLGIGKRPDELHAIVTSDELRKLLDNLEVERFKRLAGAMDALSGSLATRKSKAGANPQRRRILWWRLLRALWKHRGVQGELADVWSGGGLYSSDLLRDWLNRIFGTRTFNDAKAVTDLRIVAADVDEQRYLIYNKAKDGSRTKIAAAVHASVSIPLFFRPYTDEGQVRQVDGGLLSNFPGFLFIDSGYPTVGFRIEDLPERRRSRTTGDYLLDLLRTVTEAHDKFRERPTNFKEYGVNVPLDETGRPISSTKFNALTDKDAANLYQAGLETAGSVDWDGCSADKPARVIGESKPQETLRFSMEQVDELLDRYRQERRLWPEHVHQHTVATMRIEQDWSVRYEKLSTLKVTGAGAIVVSPFVSQARPAATAGQSLVDMRHTLEELDVSGQPLDKGPILIPAFNQEDRRGFAIIYTPPIDAANSPRTVRSGFTIPQEFAQTVGEDGEDSLACVVIPVSPDHRTQLTFRILVDSALPPVRLVPRFSATRSELRETLNGREYRVHSWQFDEFTVHTDTRYAVKVERA